MWVDFDEECVNEGAEFWKDVAMQYAAVRRNRVEHPCQ